MRAYLIAYHWRRGTGEFNEVATLAEAFREILHVEAENCYGEVYVEQREEDRIGEMALLYTSISEQPIKIRLVTENAPDIIQWAITLAAVGLELVDLDNRFHIRNDVEWEWERNYNGNTKITCIAYRRDTNKVTVDWTREGF